MNIFRRLLLNLAGGSPREKYIELRKDNAVLNGTLRRIQTSISFGSQCPMCRRTYKIHIDITKPLKDEKRPVQPAHCPYCKHRPMLWWFSMFEITSIKEVDAKKINE
jgi:uncharacterized protein YbaR (Trm112 family)